MRRNTKTRIGLLVGIALAVAVAAPGAAHARTLYGVGSDGRLVTFADKQTKVKVKVKSKKGKDAGRSTQGVKAVQVTANRSVAGLPAGVRLVGIDFRPLTGELYGVGSDSTMYKLLITGDRTALALSSGSFAGPASLSGSFFGVDFNPVPVAGSGSSATRVRTSASTRTRPPTRCRRRRWSTAP